MIYNQICCALAAEESIASLLINSQKIILIRKNAIELRHPQVPIPIMCNNTIVDNFVRNTMIQRVSNQ